VGPPSRRPARRGLLGYGLQIAQPLGGQPFQQFRNRPGGHAVEVGAALSTTAVMTGSGCTASNM